MPHAFSTRIGGLSRGIFDSLNFGNPSDLPAADRDPPANIRANFDLILDALSCRGRELVEVHQVHGPDVHIVRRGKPAHATPHDSKADAIITDDPARILAIRVADCAPVIMASGDGRIIGIAHAGWRGVVQGVIPATIAAMQSLGATRIAAAIGPCIGVDHFEVGPEVASEFERLFGSESIQPGPRGKPHANIPFAISAQLRAAGAQDIDAMNLCTACDPARFFSHRRYAGRTGRLIGIVACAQPR